MSTYAAISQSGTVVVLVATGLVLLLVTMRDTTAEMVARSETDPLSSVFNRRGFEHHAETALAREGDMVLIAADLDHFKQINDNFGHAARTAEPRVGKEWGSTVRSWGSPYH